MSSLSVKYENGAHKIMTEILFLKPSKKASWQHNRIHERGRKCLVGVTEVAGKQKSHACKQREGSPRTVIYSHNLLFFAEHIKEQLSNFNRNYVRYDEH